MKLLAVAAALIVLASPASAQITGNVEILPGLSTAGLTDLNNVILFRSANRGFQAFDGDLDASAYQVGPGDIIEINIWSPTARNFSVTVTPEGTLLIPSFGELYVSNMTLDSARTLIKRSFQLEQGVDDLTVTLTQARRVRVNVSGAVTAPGSYELAANQRITDAIMMAQGIAPDTGSVRHVHRITASGTRSFDLMGFFLRGDTGQNPYLIGGEHIIVLPREPWEDQLQVGGAVMRPGFVEYRDGDSVSTLLHLAFGFQPRADRSNIVVTRTDRLTGKVSRQVVQASGSGDGWMILNDVPLHRSDRVFVSYLPSAGRTATVHVTGEVRHPGTYAVIEDSTHLSDLVAAAGGLTPYASENEVFFLRPSYKSVVAGDTIPPLVSVNLDAALSGDSLADIGLKDRDSIHIPTRSLAVQVLGRVRQPGILAWAHGTSVSAYIERAGGYGADADRKKTRVIRAITGAIEKPDDIRPPQPGDQILVPDKQPVSIGKKIRDGLSFVSTLATTYFVIREISK